jgi:hypothetical protein
VSVRYDDRVLDGREDEREPPRIIETGAVTGNGSQRVAESNHLFIVKDHGETMTETGSAPM